MRGGGGRGRRIAVIADVSDVSSVNALVAEVTSRLGPIDICFSNAGVATGGDILTTEPEVWMPSGR